MNKNKQIKNDGGIQEKLFNKGSGARSATRSPLKKHKGITLIALIITIIIMLILVAVTINMAINGGLFKNAGKAVGETKNAIDVEQELSNGKIQVDGKWYASIDDYLVGKPIPTAEISLNIEGIKSETIPIPDGFKYKEGTRDTGYVIINETDGNEFVWVPVDKDQKITLKITSEKDIIGVKLYDPYGDEILTVSDEEIETTYNNINITPTVNGMYIAQVTTENGMDEKTLIVKSLYARSLENDWYASEEYAKKMSEAAFGEILSKEQFWKLYIQRMFLTDLETLMQYYGCNSLDQLITVLYATGQNKISSDYTENVNKNGGFYIGRYEAGTTSIRTAGNRSTAVETIKAASGIPVSKEGYFPYNYITFNQAKGLAASMYTEGNFTVSLVTHAAWQSTLNWICKTGNKSTKELIQDSGNWGNYLDVEFEITKGKYSEDAGKSYTPVSGTYTKAKGNEILLTTGATTRNSANNIFDLAGNVREWVSTSTSCYYRGRFISFKWKYIHG